MELNAKQFVQSENHLLATIARAAELGLTRHNYGLLPLRTASKLYNGIRINEHVTGNVEVQLYTCRAVTASGFLIDFDADEAGGVPLIKSYSPSEDKNIRNRDIRKWDIILAVDPFDCEPCGELDPDEHPPRHPDAESRYTLYVMPAGDIDTMDFGRHYLTIGRVRKDGDRYVVDGNYIPPCTSMSSHPELADYFNNFQSLLSSVEKSSKEIVARIHHRANKAELAVNIYKMCEDILRYISKIFFDFRNRGRILPPIDTVNYVSSLAHVCYVSLTMLSARHKEEVLKYFYEWTNVSPGSFEEMFAQTLEIIYEHDDIRAMMVRCETFLNTFAELWERLSRLEYIGQHKENIVVSEHRTEKDATKSTNTWSPID
jgi:hypothetical protein